MIKTIKIKMKLNKLVSKDLDNRVIGRLFWQLIE